MFSTVEPDPLVRLTSATPYIFMILIKLLCLIITGTRQRPLHAVFVVLTSTQSLKVPAIRSVLEYTK